MSLRQCQRVLGHHAIALVHPRGLELSLYTAILPDAFPVAVDPKWMSSVRDYNKLLMSADFFRAFDKCSHLLIHEPDAIVLEDQLLPWCSRAFDYIGAPWFEGGSSALPDADCIGVGNSGFSLFKVSSALAALQSGARWFPYSTIGSQMVGRILRRPGPYSGRQLLSACGRMGTLGGAHALFRGNCDYFWSAIVPMFAKFAVADVGEAVRFSWEVNPRRCLQMSEGKRPFGLHAWARYDVEFLRPILTEAGVDLSQAEIRRTI